MGVVFSHVRLFGLSPFGLPSARGLQLARFGVTMFFSLSGFLITYLLLLEKDAAGVNIPHFYVRRLLRTLPIYLAYLITCVAVIWWFQPEELPGSLVFYFIVAANIPFVLGTSLPFLSHLWALGVEEQFYLFWPWLVKVLRRPLPVLGLFIFLFIAVRLAFRVVQVRGGPSLPFAMMEVSRYDCMAIGAIGAVLFKYGNALFWRISTSLTTQILAWAMIVATAFNRFHIAGIIDHQIVALFTVVLILNVSSNPKTILGLDHRVFDFVGRISYGIYVIHPLIIFSSGKLFGSICAHLEMTTRYCIAYTVAPTLTILAAYAS
jgi:peptidoglycan/LPS O-acetylase OafA/YrhL